MNGPQHYAMAEGLTAMFRTDEGAKLSVDRAAFTVAMAQVHATLAVAAATWDTAIAVGPGDDISQRNSEAWDRVTS